MKKNITNSGWHFLLRAMLFVLPASASAATPLVAAGFNFTLALNSDGSVAAWGRNDYGQLGNGQAAIRQAPARVDGIGRAMAVASGAAHTLVLQEDGTLFSFGNNDNSQLGDGTIQGRSHPVRVNGFSGAVSAIAAGSAHSLAVTADGQVWAWGSGLYGQVGNGSSNDQPVPVVVPHLPKALAVAAGSLHSLALLADGSVWAWGDNSSGQLGNGGGSAAVIPVTVSKLANIVAISSKAAHNLALDASGQVWAWGYGGWGALGDGGTGNRATPVLVLGLPRIVAIEAGNAVSLAVAADGSVWLWGNDAYGQFGDSRFAGPAASQLNPVNVAALAGYSRFSVGEQHVLARAADGALRAWGWNGYGQLGVGDINDRALPSLVAGVPAIRQLAARATHSVAVADDGSVWTWGSNGNGESADPTVALSNLPLSVPLPKSIVGLSAGSFHALALGGDGSVWAWGGNNTGALGNGGQRDLFLPQRVPDLPVMTALAAGSEFSLALAADGTVWSWGSQDAGRLGNGQDSGAQSKPQRLPGLSTVTALSAGYQHALALGADGTVWAWGLNNYGQLGDGSTSNRSTPVPVPGLPKIAAVAAGDFHSLALGRDGQVWAWGYNISGQLGDGSSSDRHGPVRVGGVDRAVAIAAGDRTGYAITQDSRLWAWGLNEEGQLGAGAVSGHELAAHTVNGIADFTAVSGRSGYAVGLRRDGTVWGWGRNFEGQLGDGTFAERDAPALALDGKGRQALDLDPAVVNDIPPARLPPLLAHATRSGDLSRLSLQVDLDAAVLGRDGRFSGQGFAAACGPCLVYVAAVYNDTLLLADEQHNWVTPLPQQISNNALPAFLRGVQVSSQARLTVDILQQVDVSGMPGAQILVGYGSSTQEMLAAGRYYPVFTVPRK